MEYKRLSDDSTTHVYPDDNVTYPFDEDREYYREYDYTDGLDLLLLGLGMGIGAIILPVVIYAKWQRIQTALTLVKESSR